MSTGPQPRARFVEVQASEESSSSCLCGGSLENILGFFESTPTTPLRLWDFFQQDARFQLGTAARTFYIFCDAPEMAVVWVSTVRALVARMAGGQALTSVLPVCVWCAYVCVCVFSLIARHKIRIIAQQSDKIDRSTHQGNKKQRIPLTSLPLA